MLDAKARKANQGLILETRPDIIASHSELKSKKNNIFSLCMYFKNYQKKIHFLHHENRVQ